MKIIPLVVLILLPFSILSAQDPDHPKDEGANNPISLIRNELTNQLLVLEKKLPRAKQLQILAEARILALNLEGGERDAAVFDVANVYLRLRFTDEAKILFTGVADNGTTDESKISALEMLGNIAFVRENNIEQTVELTEKALFLAQLSEQKMKSAELLIKTGSWYFIQGDLPKMKNCYQEFLALPENVQLQLPRESLKANLYISRALKDEGNLELSQDYFARVMELVNENPDVFEPSLVLGLELGAEEHSAEWNSPKRIERFLKLYKVEKYDLEPAIIDVGNHVFWAYFLERSKNKKCLDRFVAFAKLHIGKTKAFKKHQTEFSETDFESITQVASQTIAAYSFVCDENKLSFDQPELTKQLESWMQRATRMTGKFPNGTKRDELNKFGNAIRQGVVEVLELDPESNKNKEALEPTPAKEDSKGKSKKDLEPNKNNEAQEPTPTKNWGPVTLVATYY